MMDQKIGFLSGGGATGHLHHHRARQERRAVLRVGHRNDERFAISFVFFIGQPLERKTPHRLIKPKKKRSLMVCSMLGVPGYVAGDIGNAAKTQVFFTILEESVAIGDRLLVFSQVKEKQNPVKPSKTQ